MNTTKPVFKVAPTIQQYDWGTIGLASKVAQLASASAGPNFTLDHLRPYAELWMGTHPSSPSLVFSSGITLAAHLAAHPHLIGARVIEHFATSEGNLPFLFKVLSIEKALSIQSHPDKRTAELLHATDPHIYKDGNHKPEMALAVTVFRGLCGFLPLSRIGVYLRAVPEFAALIPAPVISHFSSVSASVSPSSSESKAALKSLFSALMTADPIAVETQLQVLVARYRDSGATADEQDVASLVTLLNSQFPGDIGVFCAFMLNYVHLQPGEAIFLGAGEPHAYISGDIIECMANSDNVIRAGLTPKLRDLPNLLAGLTYSSGPPAQHAVQPRPFPPPLSQNTSAEPISPGTGTTLYDPPAPEFSVLRTVVRPGTAETHRALGGPSIVILLGGRGVVRWVNGTLDVSLGDVVFIGADTQVWFEAAAGQDDSDGVVLYRAFVEVA